jgi:hypothetical protein
MPTILRDGPYRFSSIPAMDMNHRTFHVERDDSVAKFWLRPVGLASGGAFRQRESGRIRALIESRSAMFAEAWHDYFSS